MFILSCLLHSSNVIIGRDFSAPGESFQIDKMKKTQLSKVQDNTNRIAACSSTLDGSVILSKEF